MLGLRLWVCIDFGVTHNLVGILGSVWCLQMEGIVIPNYICMLSSSRSPELHHLPCCSGSMLVWTQCALQGTLGLVCNLQGTNNPGAQQGSSCCLGVSGCSHWFNKLHLRNTELQEAHMHVLHQHLCSGTQEQLQHVRMARQRRPDGLRNISAIYATKTFYVQKQNHKYLYCSYANVERHMYTYNG